MQNKDVFKNYGSEQWVIEQNLYFFIKEYWDKYCQGTPMPCNPISFIKDFMKDETYCDIDLAEVSKFETLEANIVADTDATIVEEVK